MIKARYYIGKQPHWTKEGLDFVKERYLTGVSSKIIARELDVSISSVKGVVRYFGINRRTIDRVEWTGKEDDYLREHYGNVPVYKISKNIQKIEGNKRSPNAIYLRASKLKLNGYGRHDWYTLGDLSQSLKVRSATVHNWVKCGRLRAGRYNNNGDKHCTMMVKRKDLAIFIRSYPEEINHRPIDVMFLVEVLTDGVLLNGK